MFFKIFYCKRNYETLNWNIFDENEVIISFENHHENTSVYDFDILNT